MSDSHRKQPLLFSDLPADLLSFCLKRLEARPVIVAINAIPDASISGPKGVLDLYILSQGGGWGNSIYVAQRLPSECVNWFQVIPERTSSGSVVLL